MSPTTGIVGELRAKLAAVKAERDEARRELARVHSGTIKPDRWVDLPNEHGEWQAVFPDHFDAHVERLRLRLLECSARECEVKARCIHQVIATELRATLDLRDSDLAEARRELVEARRLLDEAATLLDELQASIDDDGSTAATVATKAADWLDRNPGVFALAATQEQPK